MAQAGVTSLTLQIRRTIERPTLTTPPVPDAIDQDLVFWIDGFPGRNFLLGHSHTFPGRMAAYSEVEGRGFSVSKYEITSMSESARSWVEGFLAGTEPSPPEYLGTGDIRGIQWETAMVEFRTSGRLPMVDEARSSATKHALTAESSEVASPSDFAKFLRKVALHYRGDIRDWEDVPAEAILEVLADHIESAWSPQPLDEAIPLRSESGWNATARAIVASWTDELEDE